MSAEFGIAANVAETDKALRRGARVWIIRGWSGGGYERVVVRGLARGGLPIEKWVPITRLEKFRAAWLPEHLRQGDPAKAVSLRGDKDDMDEMAQKLDGVATRERAAHPGRRGTSKPADEPLDIGAAHAAIAARFPKTLAKLAEND